MEPMQPMKPMAPMKPMTAWWPEELGQPATSGGQNDLRYAFFPDRKRLLIETAGRLATYDSGDHRISGVQQQQGGGSGLAFTSQHGTVALESLKRLD